MTRHFELLVTARYDYERPVSDLRQRLIVVPRERHGGQRRLSYRLDVDGVDDSTHVIRRDQFGNVVIDIRVPRVRSHVVFEVHTRALQRPLDHHRSSVHHRLRSPGRFTASDAAIAELGGRPGERSVEEICDRVHRAMTYEWGVTGVRTTAAEALAGGRGVCQDFAHIMLAACHSAGIAARYVSGHLRGEGGSHAWVEVLLQSDDHRSHRVEAWDPTHNRRAEMGYVTVAVGRDYADVRPFSGTITTDGRPLESALTVSKKLREVA